MGVLLPWALIALTHRKKNKERKRKKKEGTAQPVVSYKRDIMNIRQRWSIAISEYAGSMKAAGVAGILIGLSYWSKASKQAEGWTLREWQDHGHSHHKHHELPPWARMMEKSQRVADFIVSSSAPWYLPNRRLSRRLAVEDAEAGKVTVGLVESNGSLGLWLT